MENPRLNFKFAFNDTAFSVRVLRIEILADSLDSSPDSEGCDSVCSRKRKREEECCAAVAQVKTLNINSAILAANSPFFYKLFKNGRRESQEGDVVTLRISASEEASLMELLDFMYTSTLSVTTTPDLLGVLIAADKFQVTSCVNYYCLHLLQKMPMSQESAILYLDLRSSVFMGDIVRPLIEAAKQYLVERYCRDFHKSTKDAMALPLCAVEVILRSDVLRVDSEDNVFNFILNWARAHYPELEHRREILTKRLARLIRFPYMSISKLKTIPVCRDFDQEQVSKLVLQALFFKAEGQPQIADRRFIARNYKLQPATVIQFELPRRHCVVFFDLKKGKLRSSRKIDSEPFGLGGWTSQLRVLCVIVLFFLCVTVAKSSAACRLDYELEVMKSPSMEFQSVHKVNNCTLKVSEGSNSALPGNRNPFGRPWIHMLTDDSVYFINGILHLRARFAINSS